MGFDYALVHLQYTIPPALILTILYRPLLLHIDVYKIVLLISSAVVSTIPWDSYLIRRKIWTYPSSGIIGPTLCSIPIEEICFFVIQTYNTTLLYLLFNKPIFYPIYLSRKFRDGFQIRRVVGQLFLAACAVFGGVLIRRGNEGTYLGLILAWAGSVGFILWSLSSQFLVSLPYTSTLAPIAISTLFFWIVNTLALKRDTWTIESGTKLELQLWDGLEIEKAIFFFATNTLMVFGLVTFDYAMSILLTFPKLFPRVPQWPSPVMLVKALLTDSKKYDEERIEGLRQAVERLRKKSRSFYLASAVFYGRLRVDLVLLYSFCRVADDLVDDASSMSEAREWIMKIRQYLDLAYASEEAPIILKLPDLQSYISDNFPKNSQSAFRLLPTHILPSSPLYELLEGFETDLEFHIDESSKTSPSFPIVTEHDLDVYSRRVAGTVAELCLELVFYHSFSNTTKSQKEKLVRAGGRMGIALQYVNIARDIVADAAIGRVYLPLSWLKDEGISAEMILENPHGQLVEHSRQRLLDKGFRVYRGAKSALGELPADSRAPMRVAVESYMEIGRVLRKRGYKIKRGKATVPKFRRLKIAWKALNEG